MHYSRHCVTALLTYVATLTYASTNDHWAPPACPLVSSSKTTLCQFSSVQLRRSAVSTRLNSRYNRTVCFVVHL